MLVIVSKQKKETMPTTLVEYWEKYLVHQRTQITAIVQIANALEERNAPSIDKMVDRFLAWPLPDDFGPDGGISFKNEPDGRGFIPSWPVGTNLFTATQARQMFEHVLKD